MRAERKNNCAEANALSSEGPATPQQLWLTADQLAARYQISVRKIWYMAEDGTLPYYKCGHFTRFAPLECDLAMRAFRRSSKFDSFIEEALAMRAQVNDPAEEPTEQISRSPDNHARRQLQPMPMAVKHASAPNNRRNKAGSASADLTHSTSARDKKASVYRAGPKKNLARKSHLLDAEEANVKSGESTWDEKQARPSTHRKTRKPFAAELIIIAITSLFCLPQGAPACPTLECRPESEPAFTEALLRGGRFPRCTRRDHCQKHAYNRN